VLEAAELAKLLEEKWGVPPRAVAVAAASGAAAAAPVEEKTEFNVNSGRAGDKKTRSSRKWRDHRPRPQGSQGLSKALQAVKEGAGKMRREDQGRPREGRAKVELK